MTSDNDKTYMLPVSPKQLGLIKDMINLTENELTSAEETYHVDLTMAHVELSMMTLQVEKLLALHRTLYGNTL